MFNILKADFKKYFKSKIFIATIILILSIPLLLAGIYYITNQIMSDQMASLTGAFTAQTIFLSSFQISDFVGIVFLIFATVILVADFSQNTIRNKIILGYSKTKVYLATSIFILSISLATIFIYAFATLLTNGIFLGFDSVNFSEIMRAITLYFFAVITIYSFVQFTVFLTRSTGASIGMTLGTLLGISMVLTIINLGIENETFTNVVHMSLPLVVSGFGDVLSWGQTLIGIVIQLGLTAVLIGAGIFLNKKIDYR